MHAKSRVLSALAGILSLSVISCAALVAGGAGVAATYTYLSGWLARDYEASMDDAYQASLEAFEESNIPVVEKKKELASAEIKAETQEQTYWVKLDSKGKKLTNVAVRAGILGDREASQKIQRQIESNL